MFSLTQTPDGWLVTAGDESRSFPTHDEAFRHLAAMLGSPGAGEAPMMSARRWRGPAIALSELTGDGRDFTECAWSWRDPSQVPLPLMMQTDTDFGHQGATWVGTIDELSVTDGVVSASGSFHDTPEAAKAIAMLDAQGRLGVSVDPGMVDAEDVCTEMDDEGFCVDGFTKFNAYEIIGLTITPFPAFSGVFIEPDGASAEAADDAEADAEQDAVVAAAAPARPPRGWFDGSGMTELAPLTVTDDGRVFGFVASFDQCHVGFSGRCVTAPDRIAVDLMHTGTVVCDDGSSVATGPLVFGTDHAPTVGLSARGAVDHYAHTGMAWADCVFGVTPDVGIWCAGAVRPQYMDDATLRVLRASALSGDWRDVGDGRLSLVAVLTVNSPGFPIPRALAAASSLPLVASAGQRVRAVADQLVAAQGIGLVPQRCASCEEQAAAAGRRARRVPAGARSVDAGLRAVAEALASIDARLAALDRRTAHLNESARERLARRIRG